MWLAPAVGAGPSLTLPRERGRANKGAALLGA
jgi:hypothetical protein